MTRRKIQTIIFFVLYLFIPAFPIWGFAACYSLQLTVSNTSLEFGVLIWQKKKALHPGILWRVFWGMFLLNNQKEKFFNPRHGRCNIIAFWQHIYITCSSLLIHRRMSVNGEIVVNGWRKSSCVVMGVWTYSGGLNIHQLFMLPATNILNQNSLILSLCSCILEGTNYEIVWIYFVLDPWPSIDLVAFATYGKAP